MKKDTLQNIPYMFTVRMLMVHINHDLFTASSKYRLTKAL